MEFPAAAHPSGTTGGLRSDTAVSLSRDRTEAYGRRPARPRRCRLRPGVVVCPARVDDRHRRSRVHGHLDWHLRRGPRAGYRRRRPARLGGGATSRRPTTVGLAGGQSPAAGAGAAGRAGCAREPVDHGPGLWGAGDGRAGDARRLLDVRPGKPSAPHRRRRARLRRGACLVAGAADDTRPGPGHAVRGAGRHDVHGAVRQPRRCLCRSDACHDEPRRTDRWSSTPSS